MTGDARHRALFAASGMGRGLAVILVVCGLDQALKALLLYGIDLPHRGSIQLLPFLRLTFVRNEGISFGLLNDLSARWALVGVSGLVLTILFVIFLRTREPLSRLAMGFIIGGGAGNVIDRARFGYVVDYIDITALYFPWVFNLADMAIDIGVVLLLYGPLREAMKRRARRE